MWKFLVLGLLLNTLIVTSAAKQKKPSKETQVITSSDEECPEITTAANGDSTDALENPTTKALPNSVETTTASADSCRGDANATRGCDTTCKQRCVPVKDKSSCECPDNSCKCKKKYFFDSTTFKCVRRKDCSNNNSNKETTTSPTPTTKLPTTVSPITTTAKAVETTTDELTAPQSPSTQSTEPNYITTDEARTTTKQLPESTASIVDCSYDGMQKCDADTTTAVTPTTTQKITTPSDNEAITTRTVIETTTNNQDTTTAKTTAKCPYDRA